MTLNNKDKILTTGWAGYIGSHTCKLMSKKGISPIVFGNLSSGKKNLLNGVSLYQEMFQDWLVAVKSQKKYLIGMLRKVVLQILF